VNVKNNGGKTPLGLVLTRNTPVLDRTLTVTLYGSNGEARTVQQSNTYGNRVDDSVAEFLRQHGGHE
jgi:hypothetical protein